MTYFVLFFSLFTSFLWADLTPTRSYEEIVDQNRLQILTPSLACLKTAKIRLDNGLEALIISDPEATQSAAALAMEVGSWSDPAEYPGMAHFTEHLLFLASETYPEEGGYFKQVSHHGGMLNAYTSSDRTVYTFSVNHEAFPATLDYFSHMFIDPLFSSSGIARELHAVDQEHDKKIENDYFREYMVIKSAGNPNHPHIRFATGNAKTLGKIPRDAVVKWYRENYSSDKAHLVIYASLPIEELKYLTTKYFSAIPQTSTPKPFFPSPLTSSSQKGTITFLTPIKNIRELTVYWELPESFFLDFEDQSRTLLSYILESRHPNSFYWTLKTEGLIDHLHAGTIPFSKQSGFYAINFVLTPKGVTEYQRVIRHLFSTLNALKKGGIPSYLFEEVKNMAKIDYEYQDREHPFHYVTNAASQLIEEPLATFPERLVLPTNYDEKKCNALIHYLNPKEAQYNLKAPPSITGVQGDRVEKWSGAKYSVHPIDEKTLTTWEQITPAKEGIYPNQNPYIPSNLCLITDKRDLNKTPTPKLIIDNEFGKVYYWKDKRYLIPEVSYIIALQSPLIDRSPEQLVLIHLFEKCVSEHLKSTTFYASAANLLTEIKDENFDLMIQINGFSEKAPILLKEVLEGIKTCFWTEDTFELERSLLMNHYENFSKSSPLNQGIDLLNSVLFNTNPRMKDQLNALKKISYKDFLTFQKTLFQRAYAKLMLGGNLSKEDAYELWNQLQHSMNYLPYSKKEHLQRKALTLPKHCGPYKLYETSESLGHAAILLLQEGPFSFQKNASAAALGKEISEDFFRTLRTKQQTAYIVNSTKLEAEGQLSQLFFVQSSTHRPDELIARFELFLESYVKDFDAMISEGQFENIRTNLITTSKQPPENLEGMTKRLYHLAFTHDGDFQYFEKKVEALSNLNYETFKQDSLSFLSRNNSKRVAILLEGQPPEGKNFRYLDTTADELKSLGIYVSPQ